MMIRSTKQWQSLPRVAGNKRTRIKVAFIPTLIYFDYFILVLLFHSLTVFVMIWIFERTQYETSQKTSNVIQIGVQNIEKCSWMHPNLFLLL